MRNGPVQDLALGQCVLRHIPPARVRIAIEAADDRLAAQAVDHALAHDAGVFEEPGGGSPRRDEGGAAAAVVVDIGAARAHARGVVVPRGLRGKQRGALVDPERDARSQSNRAPPTPGLYQIQAFDPDTPAAPKSLPLP